MPDLTGMTVPGCEGWYYGPERRDPQGNLVVPLLGPTGETVVTGSPYWCDLPELGHPVGIHTRARAAVAELEQAAHERAHALEAIPA